MTKPHEETWDVYRSGRDNHGVRRVEGLGRSVVATRIASYDDAMLLAAAPGMARALLKAKDLIEALAEADVEHSEYGAVCEALRKAGVLP